MVYRLQSDCHLSHSKRRILLNVYEPSDLFLTNLRLPFRLLFTQQI